MSEAEFAVYLRNKLSEAMDGSSDLLITDPNDDTSFIYADEDGDCLWRVWVQLAEVK